MLRDFDIGERWHPRPFILRAHPVAFWMSLLLDVIVGTVRDKDVTLRLPDGSTATVPQDTLSRSTVLRQAIPCAGNESDVSFSVPKGVLTCWLQSIAALGNGFAHAESATAFTDASKGIQLLGFLKVCCYCVTLDL